MSFRRVTVEVRMRVLYGKKTSFTGDGVMR